jgi:hypothetical protein
MTASNVLRTSKEKIAIMIALFSLVNLVFPVSGKAHAAENAAQTKALVFEINPNTLLNSIKNATADSENKNPEFQNIDKKVQLVRDYLESKNSPLADYTEIILAQEDWKTILAISNAESTLGQHCYANNCSGIYCRFDRGYAGLCKYETKAHWIVELQGLIDRRYKGWSLNKMNGIYVYPKSSTWIAATSKVYNDLDKLEVQFDNQA